MKVSKIPTVLINVSGGVVQEVVSDSPVNKDDFHLALDCPLIK